MNITEVYSQAQLLYAEWKPTVLTFASMNLLPGLYTLYVWEVAGAAAALFLFLYVLQYRLRPRYFFFVRHGQTILIAQNVRPGEAGPLPPAGIAAAARTGTALEMDGQAKRFDLPANLARRAKSPVVGAVAQITADTATTAAASTTLRRGAARGTTIAPANNTRPPPKRLR